MTYHILIDSSVWLDLAKDARNLPIITALEELTKSGDITLAVPEIVRTEFARNKNRAKGAAQKSLKSHFQLVREAVKALSDDPDKDAMLHALSEVDRRIKVDSQDVTRVIDRIDALLAEAPILSQTEQQMARVAARALDNRAPFHRDRNSSGDALIVETFADLVGRKTKKEDQFALVTHNYRDYSAIDADRRQPHPDLADLFSEASSTYWLSLPDLLNSIDEDLLPNHDLEFQGWDESRRLSEIIDAEHLLYLQVWYNRHWSSRIAIEEGKIKVVPESEYDRTNYRVDQILDSIWEGALAAAKRTEDEVGKDNLGPWDDFEWGMINGKLSALRWVLGDEWDMLDT